MARYPTLYELCLANGEARGPGRCYMAKTGGAYRATSYAEFAEQVVCVALALHALGVERGDRVAILSENRPEWITLDMGALSIGAVTTPIYPSYPAARVEHLLNDCGAKAVLVSTREQAEKVRASKTPACATVIACSGDAAAAAPGALTFAELVDRGRARHVAQPALHRDLAARVTCEDLATIIYTSGTTGVEKGVMLTHANITSNVAAGQTAIQCTPNDTHLSFLPLSHVLARMADYYTPLSVRACIAFAESVETLGANMVEVQPTLLVTVPRVLEKIHAAVMAGVAEKTPLQRGMFKWALELGREIDEARQAGRAIGFAQKLQHGLAKKLVYAKIHAKTGGRLRLVVSGGAPLSKTIGEFFAAIDIPVLEGYGLTETSPVIAVNSQSARRFGTVGKPVPGVEVRIAADGEILARGPNVMRGYYNNPAATAEVIDADGWFHTGDIGVIDADGFLAITDRKKDLLILSTGKNVAPQAVESQFKGSPWVNQILVLGDKHKYVTALIVPNMDTVQAFAKSKGIASRSPEDLLADAAVLAEMDAHVKQCCASLAPFERIKRFALLGREFTIDDGSMTPTLKLRRRHIVDRFTETIADLYRGEDAADTSDGAFGMGRPAHGA